MVLDFEGFVIDVFDFGLGIDVDIFFDFDFKKDGIEKKRENVDKKVFFK